MFLNLIFTFLYSVDYAHDSNHHSYGQGERGKFRSISNGVAHTILWLS